MSAFFAAQAVAKESAMPPFDMDLTDFIAFIAFMAGAMLIDRKTIGESSMTKMLEPSP